MHKVVAIYPKIRSKQTAILGAVAALLLLAMVLAQLFGFEKLPAILGYFWGIDEAGGLLVGAVLVTLEVFALPALLGMKLSLLMRWYSGVAGGLAALYWLIASLYVASSSLMRDSGIFGGKLEMASSLLLPAISAIFVTLLGAYWLSAVGVNILGKSKSSRKG